MSKASVRKAILAASVGMAAMALSAPAFAATPLTFNGNDLVISVYGQGADGDTTIYKDNLASPITLQQLSLSGVSSKGVVSSGATATKAGQLVLPQVASGKNNAISGEFGSSSEGILQRSTNGGYLTIAGYDVAPATYNANPASYGGGTKSCINASPAGSLCNPLAQTATASNASKGVVGVQREIALIGHNGSVDTTTTLGATAFSGNNPRSVATVDGKSFYVSGQGSSKDKGGEADQGLFYATLGSHSATPINTSVDSRVVQIYKGNLYLSEDTTEGSGVTENISSYSGLPTTTASGSVLFKSKFTFTSSSQLNSLDGGISPSTKIYLSPEQYFFASPGVLYVADSGNPKGDNNGSGTPSSQGLSDGGLQKWVLKGSTWTLEYTIDAGLNLVPDTTACGAAQVGCGTTGLIGLAGKVVGDNVELFATNSTLGDLDQTYLYGITDKLDGTSDAGESFVQLYQAAPDTNIRGVALAPVPEPSSWALMIIGLGGVGAMSRRARKTARAQGVTAV